MKHDFHTSPESRTHCIRCGTCCSKGGPTLHPEDLELFKKDIMTLSHAYTLRAGELVYNNVEERLQRLDHEMIKVKGKKGEQTCIFYNVDQKACRIYQNRPLQCRALKCWDTAHLEKILAGPKLQRKHLLPPSIPFLDILDAHDKRCSHTALSEHAAGFGDTGDPQTAQAILDMLRYDHAIRSLLIERFGLDPSSMEFLLGRPQSVTIRAYGLRVEKHGPDYMLVSDTSTRP